MIIHNKGTRHIRKLRKYSNNFKKIFNTLLVLNRKGIITFCGSNITIIHDINGKDAMECFRLYEDGYYKNRDIKTRHPNILKSVLVSKKGWGLWLDQFSDGIVDCSFSEEEIMKIFTDVVELPESFVIEFQNIIDKKKIKRNLKLLSELRNI